MEVLRADEAQRDGDRIRDVGADCAGRRNGVEGDGVLENEEREAEGEEDGHPDGDDGGVRAGRRPVQKLAEGDGLVARHREELRRGMVQVRILFLRSLWSGFFF